MSNLTIYKYEEDKINLSPISFLNDTKNQTAIRELSENDFYNSITPIFTKINNLLGIKVNVTPLNGGDITDMILMRYKALSLNEIDYAFKLERYGSLGKRIDHFQLFNAEYVGKVLEKYQEWKKSTIKKNHLHSKIKKEEIPENLESVNNNIALKFIGFYLENQYIPEDKFYIYDIFDKKGLMPTDLQYKEDVKKDAILLLEQDYRNKKAQSMQEKREINYMIENIGLGKGGIVKKKCKILALEEFFRKEYRKDNKLKELKTKFK